MNNQVVSRDIQIIRDYCRETTLLAIIPLSKESKDGERYYEIKFPPVTLPTGVVSDHSILMVTEKGAIPIPM